MRHLARVIPLAVAAAVLVPAMSPVASVQAQTVDQQRQKVDDIVDELERLEEKALLLGEQYNEAVDEKAQLEVEIADAEARIGEKEADLTELRSNLAEMAMRSFVGVGGAPLGPLFEDSDDLNDVLKRDQMAKAALSAGNFSTDELDALVSEITAEREALAAKRARVEQLAESLTQAQADTEARTAEYTRARADAEAKLGELVAQEERRRAEAALREIQAQNAAAAAAAAAANARPTTSGGGGGGGSGGGAPAPSANSGSSGNSGGSTSSGSGSGGGFSAPAPSSRSGIAVQAALGQQGVPYRYATSSPGVGFDCSGLTSYAWRQAGVSLPHQSRAQFAATPRVPIDQAQPGDLLFFYSPISHVSIYLGGGQHVHAPATGKTVSIGTVSWGKVVGVGRPG
jgi:peptidoglycan DL-endopeptidase CwlO